MPPKNSIFISYRRSDSSDVTGRIYDRLREYFGREVVFKDVESIPYGDDFRSHLTKTISQCQVVIAVIGPTWLDVLQERLAKPDQQDWVKVEVETALGRDIPVIPLLVSGARMPGDVDLPAGLKSLAARNSAQARSDPDFHTDLDRLIQRLERIVGTPESTSKDIQQHSQTLLKTLDDSQLPAVKKRVLQKRATSLIAQYEALNEQYDEALDAGQKAIIKAKIEKLEEALEAIESEIAQL